MKKESIEILAPEGLHARPAGVIVKEAAKFASEIKLAKGAKEVNAKKLISVLSLGAKKGEVVVLTVEGADEDAAFDKIKTLILEAE
ncbi:HPr family phosphocarrier protein [Candidatus Epulonipiscium viviparus]|uniref:HPr family phosphocarrier protein n=1 Tax=Candidatus Epulonipiscium viviparus TaxID=420336 RepID=UPI00016BFB4C|nr:HPr family phosphocarrier protein [Candidatus Epulopiscium viviparus]